MAQVQSSQLRAHQWPGPFAIGHPVEASTTKALAPARGALLGSAIGLGCWALIALVAWAIF